jgi:hypothetical protein
MVSVAAGRLVWVGETVSTVGWTVAVCPGTGAVWVGLIPAALATGPPHILQQEGENQEEPGNMFHDNPRSVMKIYRKKLAIGWNCPAPVPTDSRGHLEPFPKRSKYRYASCC